MKVNIVVLNYNGRALLEECLPSIVEAASISRYKPKVTVLDNQSKDDSLDFLKKNFQQVDIFKAKENKVYCSYNEFFAKSDDDVILILNSDIKVDKAFLDPLIEYFKKDSKVFFVSSRMYYFDGVTYQGDRSKPRERFGAIDSDTRFLGFEKLIDKQGYAFSTGNGAFDRNKFLELGGFDEIYLPGRYEDVDLCFRSWKIGYKSIYEPKSILYHKGYGSFKVEFKDKEIHATVFRNSIFFMWKNITDAAILLRFHLWLVPRLLFFMLTGRFFFIRAFWQAILKLSFVLKRRSAVSPHFKLSDKEVFGFFEVN